MRILLAVDEEGGATGDVGGEQTDARVGGVPALDDDVVQLVAQELIDDGLVLAVDFEEVGEGPDGRERVGCGAGGVGLEDVLHGIGGVAVLADEALDGAAAALERGTL